MPVLITKRNTICPLSTDGSLTAYDGIRRRTDGSASVPNPLAAHNLSKILTVLTATTAFLLSTTWNGVTPQLSRDIVRVLHKGSTETTVKPSYAVRRNTICRVAAAAAGLEATLSPCRFLGPPLASGFPTEGESAAIVDRLCFLEKHSTQRIASLQAVPQRAPGAAT
jgi:hypothetical protein